MTGKCALQGCGAYAKKGSTFCRHHPVPEKPKDTVSLLERVVWDALKQSRCPKEHRYQGPGKSLPCRWCRTAHAIVLVLKEIQDGKTDPDKVIEDFERQLGWSLEDPPV